MGIAREVFLVLNMASQYTDHLVPLRELLITTYATMTKTIEPESTGKSKKLKS